MVRRTATLVTALLLAVGLVLAPAPGVAGSKKAAAKYADDAHAATNQVRAKRDMITLGKNACLRTRAREQAQRMAREGDLSHQSLSAVAAKCRLGYVGENVAYGFGSGRAVVRGWMKSPGHRENIVNPNFRVMGIAAVRRDNTWWVAQVFGRPR